jgi:hypothetical protein
MNRGFHISALAQQGRFVVKGVGEGFPREFASLFEAARHARTQSNCQRGLVLICSYCSRVRADPNYWSQIEAYLMECSDLRLSHGVCEDCFERQAKDLGLAMRSARRSNAGEPKRSLPAMF